MSLNRYTSIPTRAAALPTRQAFQPRGKLATQNENVDAINNATRTTRPALTHITNQPASVAVRDRPRAAGPTKAKAEEESEKTEAVLEEPRQSLKRPSSVLEQVLPAGRETIQTRSQTRSKRRRSEPQIEEVKQAEWIDIDEEDKNDPQMVSDYVNEIYEHCKEMEVTTRRTLILTVFSERSKECDQPSIHNKST